MENKKKIVHVVESFGGGVYNFLVDLLNNTIDEFDITVIYALRPQTPDNFINDFDNYYLLVFLANIILLLRCIIFSIPYIFINCYYKKINK